MAFRFSLASVLRLKESMEKREELALQKVQFEVARVRNHIDNLTDQLTEALDAREAALQKSTQAVHLQNMQSEMDAAVAAKRSLADTLEMLTNQRDLQLKQYQAARSSRQTLSDLRAQQRKEWTHDQTKMEQKFLDDIFAGRIQLS